MKKTLESFGKKCRSYCVNKCKCNRQVSGNNSNVKVPAELNAHMIQRNILLCVYVCDHQQGRDNPK